MSALRKVIWILLAASAFYLLQCIIWLKYMKKIQPQTDTYKKGKSIFNTLYR